MNRRSISTPRGHRGRTPRRDLGFPARTRRNTEPGCDNEQGRRERPGRLPLSTHRGHTRLCPARVRGLAVLKGNFRLPSGKADRYVPGSRTRQAEPRSATRRAGSPDEPLWTVRERSPARPERASTRATTPSDASGRGSPPTGQNVADEPNPRGVGRGSAPPASPTRPGWRCADAPGGPADTCSHGLQRRTACRGARRYRWWRARDLRDGTGSRCSAGGTPDPVRARR